MFSTKWMDINDYDLELRGEMLYKVHRLRLIVATTLVSFCIFFVVLIISEDCITLPDGYNSKPFDNTVKRTRVVQAVVGGPSYNHGGQDANVIREQHAKKLSSKLKELLIIKNNLFDLSKSSSTHLNDIYDDGDEIIGENDSDDDEYDDNFDNDTFEDGDFDYNLSLKVNNDSDVSKSSAIPPQNELKNNQQIFRIKFIKTHSAKKSSIPAHRSHVRALRNISLINIDGIPIAEDKIFWSKELEEMTPKGITDKEMQRVLRRLRELHIFQAHPPTWNRCGRPKNLFVVFEDGTKACARYRAPHQYLVQGEVLSFYLSRLLGIWNVPVVALTSENHADRWNYAPVKSVLRKSEWESNVTVALIQWIDNLERDKMPPLLMSALINQTIISSHAASLLKLNEKELVELLQWSDLILFDYVTGNYDRVASMQDAAEKEKKPSILNETIHNLVRSKTTGGLWLIDNESGILDSYSLLYSRPGEDSRFLNFHRQMLKTICLFRRQTVERLEKLHQNGRAAEILLNFVKTNEPLFPSIEEYDLVSKRLQNRISEVFAHVQKCSSNS